MSCTSGMSQGTRRALGCFALVMAGCGFFDDGISDYERTQKAKAEAEENLKTAGAKLERKQYPLGDAWAVDLSGIEFTEEILAMLSGLDRIAELNVSNSQLTDEELKQIVAAKGGVLFKVDVSNNDLSDAALAHLADCLYLSELNANGTKMSQAGVKQMNAARAANSLVRKELKTVKVAL